MMKPKDDHIRQKAIQGRGSNFLLEAGAGTGKTHTLVRRIQSLLLDRDRPTSMDRIAAITFTDKAAADLRLKIRERIEQQAAATNDEKLKKSLEDIDGASITTLHGFCLSLLMERPVEAGIDPGSSVLDAHAASALAESVYDEWFDQMAQKPTPAFAWYLKQKEYYERRGDYDWLWKLAQKIRSDPDILLEYRPDEIFDFEAKVKEIFDLDRSIIEYANTYCGDKSDKGFSNAAQFHEALLALPSPENKDEFINAFGHALPGVNKLGNKKNWDKESVEQFKTNRAKLKTFVERFQTTSYNDRIWELFTLAQDYARLYDRRKRRLGVLDFSDIINRALDMLRKNQDDVRRYFHDKFDYIFIDEFQDTDPLQVRIASLLCRAGGDSDDIRNLEPGRLFVIGDPKQSIYRFRRADIEIYDETMRRFEERGEVSRIQVNFRSVPGILNFVNKLFSPLMKRDDKEPASPDYVDLEAYRGLIDPKSIPENSGVHFMKTTRELGKDDDHKRLEYAAIAEWINHAVATHLKVTDKVDPKQRKTCSVNGSPQEFCNDENHPVEILRDVRFGDIAILNRRGTTFDELEETLRMHGIDYMVTGGKVYFQRPEIAAAVAGMSCLNNPDDSLALAGWLLSDYAGFSDEDLLIHALSGGYQSLSYASLPDPAENESDLTKHLRTLRDIHDAKDEAGCYKTLVKLFDLAAVLPAAQTLRRGDVAVANLNKVLDAARRADQAGKTFDEFEAAWAKDFARQRDEADYAVVEEDDNVVQIMTMHKAKGLDWPVVIIPDMAAGFQPRKPLILTQRVDEKVGVCLGADCETISYAEMKDREDRFQNAEKIRLLYVAMTRARDHLALPLFSKVLRKKDGSVSRQKGFLEFLVEAGVINDELSIAPDFEKLAQSAFDFDPDQKGLKLAANPTWELPAIVSKTRAKMPPEAAEALQERQKVHEPPPLDDKALRFKSPSEHEIDFGKSESSSDGTLLGSAFHDLMETLDFKDRASWEDALAAVAIRHELDGKQKVICQNWLETFTDSKLFAKLKKCACYTEVPFTWRGADPHSGETTDFNGAIDLLASCGDEILIVDYKTDRVASEELNKRFDSYSRQGAIYLEAVKKLIPSAKGYRMIFYFVNADREMELTS